MRVNESGRSMIEMLGVLAIIGVLSIGGLAGYTMAMNRHRANTVLDYATKCGVIAQTQGDGSKAIASTSCADASMMGQALPGVSDISTVTAERVASGATTVKVTFTGTNGVTQAIASRLGLTDATTFTLAVDEGTWS